MITYEYERTEKEERDRVGARMPIPAPDLDDMMRSYLGQRNLSYDIAVFNHWYPSRNAGDSVRRIVMPASNRSGLAYWQARMMVGPTEAKRYNSPAVPRGDSIIVVWPVAPGPGGLVVITEGPMDALAAAGAGAIGVAVMGNQPSPEAFETIVRLFPREALLLVPDTDSVDAGVNWLQALGSWGRVGRLVLPIGAKDLAAMTPKARQSLIWQV